MSNTKKQVDITWDYCSVVDISNKNKLKCDFCSHIITGGVYRMKHHLARTKKDVIACKEVPTDISEKFKDILYRKNKNIDLKYDKSSTAASLFSYLGSESVEVEGPSNKRKSGDPSLREGESSNLRQTTINQLLKKDQREAVCEDIAEYLYDNAIAFNTVKSPSFKKMVESIGGYGKGLRPPSYHEVRTKFLEKNVKKIKSLLASNKEEWERVGCTIMSDGWTDGCNRSITNFLINSPSGTVFLKSVDTSDIIKSADNLFTLLDSVVEEIGESNVVQVITDGASNYVKAGKLLMEKREKIFWSPCAAHCIDLMLSDIGKLPIHQDTISKAKTITNFIYRHCLVLNLMRKFTRGRELVRPAITRFATCFLTLKSIHEQKKELKNMFSSDEWERCSHYRSSVGRKVSDIIDDKNFWKSIKYCLKCVTPLVKVLRLVDSDEKPSMRYIYIWL